MKLIIGLFVVGYLILPTVPFWSWVELGKWVGAGVIFMAGVLVGARAASGAGR